MSATVAEAPLADHLTPAPEGELRAADGRRFRQGDRVLYHANLAPEYPLWEARIAAFLAGSGPEPVLVLTFVDRDGTRLPDASAVHLDADPLAGCRACLEQRS